ncbi:MAG: hypothetical protein HOB86_18995, partial [Rhodospirillaceae bacterium]|nr:hypothetical protein [Rhodospirillaceae bacterium]
MANSSESIFTGANGAYIAELYERFLDDPSSVDASWSKLFGDLDDDASTVKSDVAGASWARSRTSIIGNGDGESASETKAPAKPAAAASDGGDFTKAA